MDIKRHFDTYGKRPRRCVPLRLTEAFSATDERITWALMQGATSFNVEESTNGGAMWQLVSSDVTVTVDQKLTNLQLTFGSQTVVLGGTIQFGDTELDQFGNSMNDPVSWSVDSGGGYFNGSQYTAPSSEGTATIQVAADGVTETAPITIAGDNGGDYVGNDGLIYVQATDVNKVKVFTTSGALTATLPFNGPFPQGMTFRGAGDITLPNGSYLDASQTDLVLKNAAGSVIQSYIDSPDGAWTGMALDPNGTSFWACDESCYVFEFNIATGAKQEQFWGSQDLGGLGVVPDPQPAIKLGDGTTNQILYATTDGTQNLVPLTLYGLSNLPTGTTVTLTTTAPNEVDVWNSSSPQSGDTPVLGGGNGSVTWTIGSDSVPSELYVGATQGSASVDDIQFTLDVTPPSGSGDPSASTTPATAEQIKSLTVKASYLSQVTATPGNTPTLMMEPLLDQTSFALSFYADVSTANWFNDGYKNLMYQFVDLTSNKIAKEGKLDNGIGEMVLPNGPYVLKVGYSDGHGGLKAGTLSVNISAWAIERNGAPRSVVVAGQNCTIAELAQDINLDANQYTQWLQSDGNPIPTNPDQQLNAGEKFTIPNTAYDDVSIAILSWPDLSLTYTAYVVQNSVARLWSSKGYDVVKVGSNSCSLAVMEHQLGSSNIYAFSVVGHGDLTNKGSIIPSVGGSFLLPQQYTKFGIAEMRLYACFSAWSIPHWAGHKSSLQQWLKNVSKNGWFEGWSGEIGALQIAFGLGEVVEHGTY